MDSHNPYAPSPASLKPVKLRSGGGVWRDGNVLVMKHDASLPERCVKCNEDSVEPSKKRQLYWHHPGIYALFALNVVIYIAVAMVVRKKAVVAPGLCREHRARRRWIITLGWLGALGSLLEAIVTGTSGSTGLMALGILVFFLSIILSMIFARIVYPKRIDKTYVRLKGCGSEFLDALPQLPRQ